MQANLAAGVRGRLLLALLPLLAASSAGHVRFPADEPSSAAVLEPCPDPGTPCAVVQPAEEAPLWSRRNSSTAAADLLEAASGDQAGSSTEEMQLVPVPDAGSGDGSAEQLISENEVLQLRNQYRWIMDKPAVWRKRFLNETRNSSNALVEAFKNKTKPIKSLSYEGQKGFQNEFLDILGKGKLLPPLCRWRHDYRLICRFRNAEYKKPEFRNAQH